MSLSKGKCWHSNNGTAHFFAFSLVIEGTTEKVLQFMMPVKLIYNKNLGFIEQKIFF
jgi:hypothetical protein